MVPHRSVGPVAAAPRGTRENPTVLADGTKEWREGPDQVLHRSGGRAVGAAHGTSGNPRSAGRPTASEVAARITPEAIHELGERLSASAREYEPGTHPFDEK